MGSLDFYTFPYWGTGVSLSINALLENQTISNRHFHPWRDENDSWENFDIPYVTCRCADLLCRPFYVPSNVANISDRHASLGIRYCLCRKLYSVCNYWLVYL
jgi:hypothetical protein